MFFVTTRYNVSEKQIKANIPLHLELDYPTRNAKGTHLSNTLARLTPERVYIWNSNYLC